MAESDPRERLTLDIGDINHDGDGVGRSPDGRVFFVPCALPGDRIEARVNRLKKRHGIAEMTRLLAPSDRRVEAKCPVADRCGGCAIQSLDYHAQLEWKERRVADALRRLGGVSAPVLPIIGMEEPFRYRNKAQYPVRRSPRGDLMVGFYRRGSHDIVPHDDCFVQHPLIPKAALAAAAAIDALRLSVYDERDHKGFVRHIVARASFAEEKVILMLVTNNPSFPEKDAFVASVSTRVPELAGVLQNVNRERTNRILGESTIHLWGADRVAETLDHVSFEISPDSFFQVNPIQTVTLYRTVCDWAELTGNETVWDVYCGTGSIGIYLAQDAGRLLGVDTIAAAIRDAQRNAVRNGVSERALFEVGKAEELLPRWVKEGQRADVCILDPPRRGCDSATLASVVGAGAERIVYVSCNPATLARDVAWLMARGYDAVSVRPVDMFPHTPHVEAVCLLVKSD